MRGSAWIVISAAGLALAACSPKASAPPAATAPPPAPLPTASAPAPESPQAAPTTPETTASPAPPNAPAATEPVVHFSPGDYPAKERRIAALINNAESRDTLGETPRIAAEGRAQRQACRTKACIDHAYAAEETRLRKWEGSGDIK